MLHDARDGNLLCSICIDATGSDPNRYDMTGICVMPLDRTFERDRRYSPISLTIKPIHNFRTETEYYREEAYTRTHYSRARIAEYNHASVHGLSYFESAELFESWFKKLGLGKKRIMPLCFDWPYIASYLKKWLSFPDFDDMFDYRHRDLLSITLAENDNAVYNFKDIPFPKVDFSFICTTLGMEHRALQLPIMERCLAVGQAYMNYQLKRNTGGRLCAAEHTT